MALVARSLKPKPAPSALPGQKQPPQPETARPRQVCKPAVASIFASLWNKPVHRPETRTLQDTNDRFLANIQRGGSYSVVPRIPGGEITPAKLKRMCEVAEKYGLYMKITGAQRMDMFGAPVHALPDIWEELVNAGASTHTHTRAISGRVH